MVIRAAKSYVPVRRLPVGLKLFTGIETIVLYFVRSYRLCMWRDRSISELQAEN